MSTINPLAKARGHGSAKSGVRHWFAQRLTAVLLIFLAIWLIYALIKLAGADYAQARAFASDPANAAFLLVLVLTMVYHAMLGMQVVIEDYVHRPSLEISLHFIVRAGALIGAALATVHVLKLAVGA